MSKKNRRILLGIAVAAFVLLGCALPSWQQATPSPASTPVVIVVTATPAPAQNLPVAGLSDEQIIIDIYKRASPGVVSIQTIDEDDPEGGSSASGMVYDADGHIVTNEHVVRGGEEIWVFFSDETGVRAELLGSDADADLAVLRVDVPAELLVPLELGSSAELQVGQVAIAIGNPYAYERTLTVGHISALGRVLQQESNFSIAEVIQTDAAINPGNSGGPLLDSLGRVIGINSYYRPSSLIGGSVGIGFAVPVDEVKMVVPALIAEGRYRHPWLGISGYTLRPPLVEALDLPTAHGVLVADMSEDGPAARAGLQDGQQEVEIDGYLQPIAAGGDIIIAIDAVEVRGMDDIITYLQRTRVGQVVTLTVLRDGEQQTIEVELGERPQN